MLCSGLTLPCCFDCITFLLDWFSALVDSLQPQINCVLCFDPITPSLDYFTAFIKSLWPWINWVLYSNLITSSLNHLVSSAVLLANLIILTLNSFSLLFCRLLNLLGCLPLFPVISFSHYSVWNCSPHPQRYPLSAESVCCLSRIQLYRPLISDL